MGVVCPSCGAADQQPGKYCENCGFLIPLDAASAPPAPQPVTQPAAAPAPAPAGPNLHFALVVAGTPRPDAGFAINQTGEFLVGRVDQDTGHTVDLDLRQWVQPLDSGGQKQYLIHRKQCYLGLAADGSAFIRPAAGAETDTLIKGQADAAFTSLQNLDMVRQQRSDGSFPLLPGDQIFMGDPSAVSLYLAHDPTAAQTYAVFQLMGTPA